MKTIVCIADLQGMALDINPELIPDGDILIIAGDIANNGTVKELEDTNTWLKKLPHKYKVIVAGNHDQDLEEIDGHLLFKDFIYLQDEGIEIEGLKLYGSPLNEMNNLRYFTHWAFCEPDYIREMCEKIPKKLDILITHGPPYGIRDVSEYSNSSVGSRDLRDAVIKKKPKHHVFGHIHEGHGMGKELNTNYINAALCSNMNQMFKNVNQLYYDPIVLKI